MKKSLIVALVMVFTLALSCASGGGAAKGSDSPGEVFVGNWTWERVSDGKAADGDTSICTVVEAQEEIDGKTVTTYTITGTVTQAVQYGIAHWTVTPADAETLEKLKVAKSVSFKAQGDGKKYLVELPINTVLDWGFHVRTVTTEEGAVIEPVLQMRSFNQPAWASSARFNQNLLTHVNLKTQNAVEGGTGDFKIKMWDFKLYL